jgi:hypothetical protein
LKRYRALSVWPGFAAELDEPGAMQALIAHKLSAITQFHDRPGACKLIETAG